MGFVTWVILRLAKIKTPPPGGFLEKPLYDITSPFPPTAQQLSFCGKILGNSIAALFAQQSPSPEISYAAVVAEQLTSYTRPIMEFTINQFEKECCHRLYGDLNFGKAAANKALNNLDMINLLNDHYQLMWDFSVWDIFNPPSLLELKLLSKRYPYQPISQLLRKEVDNFKKRIHSQIDSIIQYRQGNSKREKSLNMDVCVPDIVILLLKTILYLKITESSMLLGGENVNLHVQEILKYP